MSFLPKKTLAEGNQRLQILINSMEWSQEAFKDQDGAHTQGNTVNRELGERDKSPLRASESGGKQDVCVKFI